MTLSHISRLRGHHQCCWHDPRGSEAKDHIVRVDSTLGSDRPELGCPHG